MRTTLARVGAAAPVLAVIGAAWAHGPTRQKVRELIEINAAPDKVWAVIGNFQDMSWLPPVTKTEGDKGNGRGHAEADAGGWRDSRGGTQHIRCRQDDLSYRITDVDVKVLPVTNYSSTLTVTPSADGKSEPGLGGASIAAFRTTIRRRSSATRPRRRR